MSSSDYSFIHKLPYPTGVFTFDGKPIICNDAMLISTGAYTMEAFLKLDCPQRLMDEGKYKLKLESIIETDDPRKIRNILKKNENTEEVTTSCCKIQVLSREDETFIVQNTGSDESNSILLDRFSAILKDIKSLNPYLNKKGRELLSSIIDNTNTIEQYAIDSPLIIEKAYDLNLKEYKLSKTETYICVLIFFKFSNFEISYLSGFTPNSIRVNIHRICKKLSVASREDLEIKFENHSTIKKVN